MNKYKNWYDSLILKAKNRKKIKEEYYEKHHIIPKSMGGKNNATNLVALTAREHYIAHLLLVKFTCGKEKSKMVRALVRFAKKSGRSFELARKIIAKESIGVKNSSYGKKWCYDPSTKEILYCQKENIPNEWIVGLPEQRGGHRKSKWINDGNIETIIMKTDIVPNGWVFGRLNKPSDESRCKASKARHTKENDFKHSQMMRGRIQVSKNSLTKKIHKDDLEKYFYEGWEIKSVANANSKKCIIEGKKFDTLAGAANAFQINLSTLTYRLKNERSKWTEWAYIE